MRTVHALLTSSLLLVPIASAQQYDRNPNYADRKEQDPDTTDIQHVMDAFHQAVGAHDGQRVGSLFVTEGSTWFNVLSDKGFAAAKAKTPSAQKVRHSTLAEFSHFVSSSSSALNPQHGDIQIRTDGTIASVYFTFVFLIDGKAENHGSETWQLVKAVDGWKIAAITYSSNP